MAEVLRVLAHGYRLRIVEFLDMNGPSPVYRIVEALGGPQGALSQHLNKMRLSGLLRSERRGKEVWYAIANPDSLTILNCMRKRCK
jgi:ArsR family transcriptional regulator